MTDNFKKTQITLKGGKPGIVSTVYIPCYNQFETLVTDTGCNAEYAVVRSANPLEAMGVHNKLVRQYNYVAPKAKENAVGTKYYQLMLDLREAREAAKKAVSFTEDGGACNFDAVAVKLPRWIEKQVEQAAKDAGCGCFVWNFYGNKRFVFPHHCGGQADARSAGAEAMYLVLKRMGYDATMYYALD